MTLAIVILNWNGKKLLEQFLPSVVRYSPEGQLYIVDNASTDDSLDFVRTIGVGRVVLVGRIVVVGGGGSRGP